MSSFVALCAVPSDRRSAPSHAHHSPPRPYSAASTGCRRLIFSSYCVSAPPNGCRAHPSPFWPPRWRLYPSVGHIPKFPCLLSHYRRILLINTQYRFCSAFAAILRLRYAKLSRIVVGPPQHAIGGQPVHESSASTRHTTNLRTQVEENERGADSRGWRTCIGGCPLVNQGVAWPPGGGGGRQST